MKKIVELMKKPSDPSVRELLEKIALGGKRITVGGLEGSSRAFLLSLLFRHLRRTLIVIVSTEKEAEGAFRDIFLLLGNDKALFTAPLGSPDDRHVCLSAGDGAHPPGGTPSPDASADLPLW